MMATLYPVEELRNHIEEVRIRVDKPDAAGRQVLSVTNVDGLTKSDRRTSDDLSNYLCVEEGFFAYNPYRINVGSIGLARGRNQVGVVSPAYVVFRTRSTLLPEYLLFLLHSPDGLAQIQRLTSGSVRQTLRFAALCRFRLPLPPLPVQRRIVAVLEQADELRLKRAEANRLAEQVLPALFVKMFGDPATNPRGWPVHSVRELLSQPLSNGKSIKGRDAPPGVPSLKLSAIQPNGTIDASEVKYVNLPPEEAEKYKLRRGDFLVSRGSGSKHLVGRGAIFLGKPPICIYPDLMIRIKFRPDLVLAPFFCYLWNSSAIRAQIEATAKTTSGIWKINQRDIMGFEIPLPPVEVQERFVRHIEEMWALRQQQTQSHTILDNLFQTLLACAFRGELVTVITLAEAFGLSQRQVALLALLTAAAEVQQPEPMHITPLMKYAFLFQQEGGRAARADDQLALPLAAETRALYLPGEWYDFVPHKYGPFAKELYNDLEALEAAGLVERRHPPKDTGALREKTSIYLADEKTETIRDLVDSLPAEVRQGVEVIIAEYGELSQRALLDLVYQRYPEYTVNSERPGWTGET